MAAPRIHVLDVRSQLARGEEPFPVIRARLAALPAAERLTVIAPFLPAPLIELHKGEGYSTAAEHRADGAWAVTFWRS